MNREIPFFLTKPQYLTIKDELDAAVQRVLDTSFFVLGTELTVFEAAWASYLGVARAVGVGSGTEAIHLALRALDIGPGDEVLTVSHTAVATTVAISSTGATPVFVDIDPHTYTMDGADLERRITPRSKAIVPVHLYGHPADMDRILALAERHGLVVVEDAAQAHGAAYRGRRCGTLGAAGAFSFYPTKNLGAYGDGGAVVTNDTALAERLVLLRNYGWSERYYSAIKGYNSRLDELQAAVLGAKLPYLDAWNARRRRLAALYTAALAGDAGASTIQTPIEAAWATDASACTTNDFTESCKPVPAPHTYHLYVVRVPERDRVQAGLRERGIATQVHYPVPVHLQEAYQDLGYTPGSLPHTEQAAAEILSLPLYPELTDGDVQYVAAALRETVAGLSCGG